MLLHYTRISPPTASPVCRRYAIIAFDATATRHAMMLRFRREVDADAIAADTSLPLMMPALPLPLLFVADALIAFR